MVLISNLKKNPHQTTICIYILKYSHSGTFFYALLHTHGGHVGILWKHYWKWKHNFDYKNQDTLAFEIYTYYFEIANSGLPEGLVC